MGLMRSSAFALVLIGTAAGATPLSKRSPSQLGGERDEPAKSAPRPNAGADVALLRGLMWAFDPAPTEIRVQAIEDLGLLGDVRALNGLAHLSLDANPSVSRAAIRAIGAMRTSRAEEILRNIVLHPGVTESSKAYAMELLPMQNTTSALRFVRQVASSSTYPGAVLAAARRVQPHLPGDAKP